LMKRWMGDYTQVSYLAVKLKLGIKSVAMNVAQGG